MTKADIQKLMEERGSVVASMREIQDGTPADEWGAEQTAAWDNAEAREKELTATIDRETKVIALEDRQNETDSKLINHTQDEKRLKLEDGPTYGDALSAWVMEGRAGMHESEVRALGPGTVDLTAEERDEVRKVVGSDVPLGPNAIRLKLWDGNMLRSNTEWLAYRGFEHRAGLKAGTATVGAETVPDDPMRALEEALLFIGGVRNTRAEVIRTATGRQIPIPTSDDTGNVGALVAEAATAGTTSVDPTIGQAVLDAFRYSSKPIRASREFMVDTSVNPVSYILGMLGRRIGRITNQHFTTGTGSSQPQGVDTAATLGNTAAAAAALVYTDFVDLEHSLNPAHRSGAEWQMLDATLAAIKKLLDGNSLPIWNLGFAFNAPNTILGYPYVLNEDFAGGIAADAHSLLFGDHAQFKIRDVTDVVVLRLEERFAEFNEIGFYMFSRHDSVLVDNAGGTGPIVYGRHPAS